MPSTVEDELKLYAERQSASPDAVMKTLGIVGLELKTVDRGCFRNAVDGARVLPRLLGMD
ncbi:hypothetical protein [Rhizobium yanglingense]